ncbi:MAG: type VII toxin-antitoxin system MntA family adenylyltransferase antitoxin, partial [Endozoicomonas sp.]
SHSLSQPQSAEDTIKRLILQHEAVDAIYLYGSRGKGCARDDSDWDVAVLFSHFETDLLERAVRPQMLESILERQLPDLEISIVDLREVPVPLQWNIIQGRKLFDGGVPTVRRLEHGIISAWEKDYER